jgi:hypothetical protein
VRQFPNRSRTARRKELPTNRIGGVQTKAAPKTAKGCGPLRLNPGGKRLAPALNRNCFESPRNMYDPVFGAVLFEEFRILRVHRDEHFGVYDFNQFQQVLC